MNKEKTQGKIELHLGGCKQNNQTPEVPNDLYTEWKDWASNRFNNGWLNEKILKEQGKQENTESYLWQFITCKV